MQVIVIQILMALAQTAIAALGGALVGHHIIDGSQEATLTAWLLNHAAIAAPIVAAFAWTLWLKYRGRLKMLIALQPGVHTEDQVKAILKSGEPTPTIFTPPDTVPGVPKPVSVPTGLSVDLSKVGKP